MAIEDLRGTDLLIIFVVAQLGALLLAGILGGIVPAGAPRVVGSYLVAAGSLLASTLAWLAPRRAGGGLWRSAPPRWLAAGAAVGVLLRLAGTAVTLAEERVLPRIVPNNPALTNPQFFHDPAAMAALVVATVGAAPLAEEVFYRGVLFRWLAARMPLGWAVAVSALVFGAAHLDWTLILPLAVAGAGLALLYRRTQSLWPCMVAHACLNALALGLVVTGIG